MSKKHCMKKIISILFLLLTSIAVVVDAVVPHHHHNKLFTSAISFLGEDTNTLFDHHDAKFIHHISNAVIYVYDAQQSTADVLPLQACPIDNSPLYQADLYGISVILKPYLAFGYPAVIINSLGLRAPPFC